MAGGKDRSGGRSADLAHESYRADARRQPAGPFRRLRVGRPAWRGLHRLSPDRSPTPAGDLPPGGCGRAHRPRGDREPGALRGDLERAPPLPQPGRPPSAHGGDPGSERPAGVRFSLPGAHDAESAGLRRGQALQRRHALAGKPPALRIHRLHSRGHRRPLLHPCQAVALFRRLRQPLPGRGDLWWGDL